MSSLHPTIQQLQALVAEAQRALPDGWSVGLVAAMPAAKTRDQVLLISTGLASMAPALRDLLDAECPP